MARAADVVDGEEQPPIVGARAITVGAAGTARSSAYSARPVTMSCVSSARWGGRCWVNWLGSFGVPGTAGTVTISAAAASEP